jgi:hypothetical protein
MHSRCKPFAERYKLIAIIMQKANLYKYGQDENKSTAKLGFCWQDTVNKLSCLENVGLCGL